MRVGAAGGDLGTSSWLLTPGVGGVAPDSGKTAGVILVVTLVVMLATGSPATSFSRL